MSKEEQVMQEIKTFVRDKCQSVFGFVGLAEGDGIIMINSGETKTLTIQIKVKSY